MQFSCWIDCRNLQGYVGGNKPELEVVIVLPNHHKTALITIMPSFLIIIMTVDWICLELLLMKHNTYRTQSRFYGNMHRSGPIPKCYIQSPYLSWADTHVSPAYWSLGPAHERNGYYQKTLLTFSWRQITRGFGFRPFKVSPCCSFSIDSCKIVDNYLFATDLDIHTNTCPEKSKHKHEWCPAAPG